MPMIPSAARPGESLGVRNAVADRFDRPEITDQWKEEFVESLLRELRRQLQQLQNAGATPDADQAGIRSLNVMTLARIERSLERLLKMQEDRALKRDLKTVAKDDDARAALERKLDQLLAAARSNRLASESEL